MTHDRQEVEVKIRISEDQIPWLRETASRFGFEQTCPPTAECNLLFDYSDGRLRESGQALRLRQYGNQSWITFKGPKVADPLLKIRLELETVVEDFETARRILEQLGLHVSFRYDKTREKYRTGEGPDAGELSIDQTPVGCFVEIEGSRQTIRRLAHDFGWSEGDFVTANYVDLYAEQGLGR
jgi:adenylate cyclase class 2